MQLQQYKSYHFYPMKRELLSDSCTPIQVLRILQNKGKHCFLLESVEKSEHLGRYTILGYNPKLEIVCEQGRIRVRNEEGAITYIEENPISYLNRILAEYTSPRLEEHPPFTGGFVGYFAYDFARYVEPKLRLTEEDEEGFRDMDLMLFDKAIVFDHVKQRILLFVNLDMTKVDTPEEETEKKRVSRELEELENLILTGQQAPLKPGKLLEPLKPAFGKEAFMAMVEKAKSYIYDGDIFQVVLSNRLIAKYSGGLLNAYRMLRASNPSPYMFYLGSDDMEIMGASPETLVKVEQGKVSTYPIAGTRPRGKTPQEDKEREEELKKDEKECAEHNMLVDLGRNDLGKISKFGTVKVEKYMEILRFSHVMHIASTVVGQLKEGSTPVEALAAILPAGTLSGAPKIRAMEIIDELEKHRRGIYGGAIGYFSFTGDMDMCIAIRMAFLKNGTVYVRSGAGIVADSNPESEYLECLHKAGAVVEALEKGGAEGHDFTH